MFHKFESGRRAAVLLCGVSLIAFVLLRSNFNVVLRAQSALSTASQSASTELDGELEVQIEDSVAGSRVHHFLKFGDKRVRLRFPGNGPEMLSGTRVRARGNLKNNELTLSSGSSVQAMALAASNTFGEQRVAVILINFQDNPSVPYNYSKAQDVTFNSTNAFYLENSYGQTWLTGSVFGWYTLPMSNSTCDYNQVASLADQAAAAQGVNLSQYTRRIYAFPQSGGCSWWGLGTVGGTPSRAWINGSYAVKVVGHELGHNFGDYHSNSQPCETSGCSHSEYGDDRDMMGMSSVGHFNAYQKERLGWLNYGTSPAIQNVTSSGTYWIEAYGTPSNGGPKALRILKSGTSGNRTWYYIESRAQLGFDNGFAGGVTVHTGSESTGNSSYQIDLLPTTSSFDSLLDPGQVFTDPSLDLAITTVSATSAGAFVTVSYPGVPCTTGAPTVSLSPGSTMGQLGQPTSVTLSVRNNDNASACSPVSFGLDATVPSGWSASYGQQSIVVAPGSTVTAPLTVTPTTSGTGQVNAMVTRQTAPGPGGSASATVNVVSSLGVTLSIVKSNGYQISATVKAGSTPVSGLPVSFSVRNPLGKISTSTATTNSSGLAKITIRLKGRDPKGTYSVTATASSAGLAGTATGSFVY